MRFSHKFRHETWDTCICVALKFCGPKKSEPLSVILTYNSKLDLIF